jgi:hypothetical protein
MFMGCPDVGNIKEENGSFTRPSRTGRGASLGAILMIYNAPYLVARTDMK